ncbi:MAG: hypothetical protein GY757_56675 [bacterium]|nr:hypothetical protein [bacterium]
MYTGTFGMEANLPTLIRSAEIIQEKNLPISFEMVGPSIPATSKKPTGIMKP